MKECVHTYNLWNLNQKHTLVVRVSFTNFTIIILVKYIKLPLGEEFYNEMDYKFVCRKMNHDFL